MILILCTVPDEETAEKLAKGLVSERLSPCVNIIPKIRSIYFWDGKVEDDGELLLLIKSKKEFFEEIKKYIVENHPYVVPEIISFKIESSFEKYRDWFLNYLHGMD